MTVDYVGSLSIGDAVPGAASAAVAGVAGINGALPDITARIAALLAFTPTPVSFSAQLALAQQTVVSIQAAIAGGFSPPDISAQIAAVAAELAALQASALAVQAQLAIVVAFQGLLTSAGVHAYAYNGQAGNLGSEFSAELAGGLPGGSGPTEAINALVLATNIGATWAAMSSVFKVSP